MFRKLLKFVIFRTLLSPTIFIKEDCGSYFTKIIFYLNMEKFFCRNIVSNHTSTKCQIDEIETPNGRNIY